MSRLATRVARLENHIRRIGESSKAVVCWIGPDGVPEDLLDHLTRPVRVIHLRGSRRRLKPVRECALRRQQQPEAEPPMPHRFDGRLRRLEQQRQGTDTAWHQGSLACWPTPTPSTLKQSPWQLSLMPSWMRRLPP